MSTLTDEDFTKYIEKQMSDLIVTLSNFNVGDNEDQALKVVTRCLHMAQSRLEVIKGDSCFDFRSIKKNKEPWR